jgi:hypothetical protein
VAADVLASDHYVIFVGCTQDITCPRLPSGVLSAAVVHGGVLAVITDPSSDRLSEAAQPFRGELSFTVPGKETVSLDLSAQLTWTTVSRGSPDLKSSLGCLRMSPTQKPLMTRAYPKWT